MHRIALALLICIMVPALAGTPPESICHGTPEKGSLEHGWKLPASGNNFQAYSSLGRWMGRTYVHSQVYRSIEQAYAELAKTYPDKFYVYGETGKQHGGEIKPHKTHRNGTSVDFMVPVLNEEGKSVPLPTGIFNKFGYGIEFSSDGKWKGYRIDFDAMADHLAALKKAAEANGIGIRRVIFDNQLRKLLLEDGRDKKLAGITFTKFKPWIRHDEHYHVDFAVHCEP